MPTRPGARGVPGGRGHHFTLHWPPSHVGSMCVPRTLLGRNKVAALDPRTADSWIPQNITVKTNLPAEKHAAYSQAKYK